MNVYYFARRVGLLLSACALSSATFAQGALTEQESVRRGLARPDLAASIEATLDAARGDVAEAGRWANPTLSLQRESIGTGRERSVERTYQLSQQFDVAGKRGLRRGAAQQRLGATLADTEQRRRELAGDIRTRYYEALYRQQLVATVGEWERRMDGIAQTVDKLHKGGDVAGYDRRRIALERASVQTRRSVEQAHYDKVRLQLAAIIGENNGVARLDGELLPPDAPTLEAMLAQLGALPALRALEQRAGAFELDRQAANREWIPDVTIGVGPRIESSALARERGNTVNVSLPLPLFDRNQGGRQKAAAQSAAARSEANLLRARMEGDLRGGWQQARQLGTAARAYREQAGIASQDLVRIAEASYRGGESGILELLDAYRAAFEADSRAWELAWNARQAAIELDIIAGSTTP